MSATWDPARSDLAAFSQPSLFGDAPLAGLSYSDAFVGEEEQRALIERIDAAGIRPFRFQQWTGKRLTASFGWSYDFETGRFARAEAIPEWLAQVRPRAERFAGVAEGALEQALILRYDPGAGIGWHRDRPVFEHVVGISLGAPATLRFRQRQGTKFVRVSVPLAAGSIYHLSGEARHEWEHSIAPMAETRWSITLRSLARPQPASKVIHAGA